MQHEPRQPFIPNPPPPLPDPVKPNFAGTALALFCYTWALLPIALLFPFRALHKWCTFKTICCWCKPAHRLSGAPWVRDPKRISHGMCRPAFLREAAKFEPQIRCQILHSLNSEISNSQILNYNEDHP